jgi:hypothetical protein
VTGSYWSPARAGLLADQGVWLLAPSRSINRAGPRLPRRLTQARRRIETVIGQLVERYHAKRVWARDAWHLWSRWQRKLLSHTLAVYLCPQHGPGSLRFADLLTQYQHTGFASKDRRSATGTDRRPLAAGGQRRLQQTGSANGRWRRRHPSRQGPLWRGVRSAAPPARARTKGAAVTTQNPATGSLSHPGTTRAFRAVRWLVGAYLLLSVLTVVAIITLSNVAPDLVNQQAWVRGIIVAATSILTFVFAERAAKGYPRALLRLRIVVVVILVAVGAVLLFLSLPGWMIVEQAVCAALLLATAIIIFGRNVASTS